MLCLSIISTGNSFAQERNVIDSLIRRGEYFYLSDPDSALSCFTRALDMARAGSFDTLEVRARAELANQHFHNGDYSVSIPLFRSLLEDLKPDEFLVEASLATLRLGHMYDETGEPDSALHFFLRTIAIDDMTPAFIRPEVRVLIAQLYDRLGRYDEAEKYLRENLQLNKGNDKIYEGISLFELSRFYLRRDAIDSFIRYNELYLDLMDFDAMEAGLQLYHYEAMFQDAQGNP